LRVQLLLGGTDQTVGRSLVAGIHNDAVQFISDKRYQERLPQELAYDQTEPLAWTAAPTPGTPEVALPHGAVSPSLLLAGIHKENYRVRPDDAGRAWLCLNLDDTRCWPLVQLAAEDLPDTAHRLRELLIGLNKSSEGFHLLEHVLLRPRGEGVAHAVEDDFYTHQVSVVLPAFTARFSNRGCQAWVEEMIAQNLPAHVLPRFYWLDFAFLAQFELRYRHWLELLGTRSDGGQIDAAAAQLIEFLQKVAQFHTNRYWM
jgi:hypothetical protein